MKTLENASVAKGPEIARPSLNMASEMDLSLEQKKQALIESLVQNTKAEGKPYDFSRSSLQSMLSVMERNAPSGGEFSRILNDLSRLCTAVDGPADLVKVKYDLAADIIYELSDPSKRIHQGDSLACAITAREYIKSKPSAYTSFFADLANKGFGHLSVTEAGIKQGRIDYKPDTSIALNGRTLGCAVFQDLLLSAFGSIQEGTMPAHIEQAFESTRGRAATMFTASKNVSDSPQSINQVLSAIEDCAKTGKAGVISLLFSEQGAHSKHVFEICRSDGLPQGFIRLSNPASNSELPATFSKIAKDNGDGTVTLQLSDLTDKNLYLAVIESGSQEDFGRTTGIKEWQYKSDGPVLTQYQYGLPFLIEKEQKKKSEVLIVDPLLPGGKQVA